MSQNKIVRGINGWAMLVFNLFLYAMSVYIIILGIGTASGSIVLMAVALLILSIFTSAGFFIVNPNYAAVLILFGSYKGTVTSNGFWWSNPFLRKVRISLRVRNQETSKLKVNDSTGNPVEIAAIVVWKGIDPYKAQFDVDVYTDYVSVQSESAVRHLASSYPYDGPDDAVTLRKSADEVNDKLQDELEERLQRAGVQVIEARLSHLAYAPEIAGEMLRRQQASAVVAARATIVEGAVGMVEHALNELDRKGLVQLDPERKAAMVGNLLVVLCSDNAATPVVNAGSTRTSR